MRANWQGLQARAFATLLALEGGTTVLLIGEHPLNSLFEQSAGFGQSRFHWLAETFAQLD
jgi:hypothetical protein